MSSGHVVPLRTYFMVFFALLLGTALTVGVTFFNFGSFNTVLALAIALTKATLVVLYFMHVKQSSALTKMFVLAGLFWFLLLLVLTGSDYISRNWLPEAGNWQDPKNPPVQTR